MKAFWVCGNCWLTMAIPEIIEILELAKGDALRNLLKVEVFFLLRKKSISLFHGWFF
ncbi:hypothetical protein [Candidatus Enterococcus courvalinii]|uniref:Uncharacterized protein n=1 Tax=Candidatus Enterococcus courvalinii TaxID=2815329 RepID=A0ABS3I259_9ENTE|nr:hypothetical protein [Enterococcus sp. MSG2901]MBO0482778.1 hypothetical protein [Enterococcus sp. MSG2901]